MSEVAKLNYRKGALLALGGPIVGIILWVVIWQFGFIASTVAFVMAWLTIWLYKKGAGGVDKKSLEVIIPYIVIGLVLAFIAVFSLDSAYYAQGEVDGLKGQDIWQILTSASFWSFNLTSLLSPYDVGQYAVDIIISAAFGVFGTYSTIKSVREESDKKNDKEAAPAKAISEEKAEAPKKEIAAKPEAPTKKQKKAWIAVLLNLIPGAGYIYLNPKRVFGWILISVEILFFIATLMTWEEPIPEVTNASADALGSLAFLLLGAAFMVDAYFETKRINKSK
jgi:hypothetical protein